MVERFITACDSVNESIRKIDIRFRIRSNWPRFVSARSRRLASAVLVGLVLGVPWLMAVLGQFQAFDSRVAADLAWILVDPDDALDVAAYINPRIQPDDLVLASPAIAWLFDSQVTDFQVSLAFDGLETWHFPRDIPPSRYTFNPRVTEASFVVVDRIWDNWAATNVPDLDVIMDEIAGWPLAAQIGEYRIYRNPDR